MHSKKNEYIACMETSRNFDFIGKGIYTLQEAGRLTGIPSRSIMRWTKGYDFNYRGYPRHSPPVIAMNQKYADGQLVLEFLDLVEVRFLNAFRIHGVSWNAIRIAAQRAKELLQRTHPFSTQTFKTDGRTILADFVGETGDKVLLDLVRNQYTFRKVIKPYLYGGLEFNEYQEPARWYPLKKKHTIVIDPARRFGAPIITDGGVATRIIYQSYLALQSHNLVANCFEVDSISVRDAIEYEQSLVH